DATQTFTLTVDESAAFSSPASTTFTAGTAGTFTVTASGFPAPTLSESGTDAAARPRRAGARTCRRREKPRRAPRRGQRRGARVERDESRGRALSEQI